MSSIDWPEILIISLTIIIILFIFRKRLRHFIFKIGKEGLLAKIVAGDQTSEKEPIGSTTSITSGNVDVSGNIQKGEDNLIDVGLANAIVRKNIQSGSGQKIVLRPDEKLSGSATSSALDSPDLIQRNRISHFLIQTCNERELRDLCFQFNIDYDSLSGDGMENKTKEIVLHFVQNSQLIELEQYCRKLHPEFLW